MPVEFSTDENDHFMLVPEKSTMDNWQVTPLTLKTNQQFKSYADQRVTLGLPRMF